MLTSSSSSHWREALAAYIKQEAKPVEKYSHQPRLYGLTRMIGQGSVYDDDVVYAACYLHDLGVFVGHRPEEPGLLARWDNVAYAMAECPAVLGRMGFPQEKVAAVLEAVRTHQPGCTPESIEATMVRDADILEQLGAVGILRTVAKIGRDTRFMTFADAVGSLAKALQELPARLLLEESKVLAAERVRVHRAFIEAALAEAGENLD